MILIAEDDEQILRLLRRAFEREGYDVIVARDGQEALELATVHRPRLVLSDIWMPRLDGIELAGALPLAYGEVEPPKVILMSAFEAKPEGNFDAFVPKPFDLQHLIQIVEGMLEPLGDGE